MSMKHTPGPWTMETVPTSIGSCHKIGPFLSAGHRPHTYACVYADGIRVGIDEAIPAAIELAANARLIAAAPDLLDALQAITDQLERIGDTRYHKDGQYIEAARAAIAKATGAA